MRTRAIDRRQSSLDFGSKTAAIPLAARRAVQPSPNYHEMARFVRQVRAAGIDNLKQLRAMVNFAIDDSQRLASLHTNDDFQHLLHSDVPGCPPAQRPVITDEDIPF